MQLCLICKPYMYALYVFNEALKEVCLMCVPYVYALYVSNAGSWPSMYEGLDVIRDTQGNLVHVAGGIRHGTIGRFDAARMQAMGVQGPIHPVQVDFAARMPTHVYW